MARLRPKRQQVSNGSSVEHPLDTATDEQLGAELAFWSKFDPEAHPEEFWHWFTRSDDVQRELFRRFREVRDAGPGMSQVELQRWAGLLGEDEVWTRLQRLHVGKAGGSRTKILSMGGDS